MTIDIDAYLQKAHDYLAALNAAHADSWGLGSDEQWDADQQTGVISWTFPDRVAVAPFQVVGSYNTSDETFLWAWDDPSVLEPLTQDAKTVLAFAKQYDIEFLQDRKLGCPERGAWDLAALATGLCKRQGMYRGLSGDALTYMTFGSVQLQPLRQAS